MQPPTAEEIRAQLDRMLTSEVFATSARLRRFLRYVVEQTLAGKGEQLKEYAIGIGVFDRNEQYDPRIDSIVRVEAGRLRAKIDEHYNGVGASDPVLIRIPRGSYAPVFEHRSTAQALPDPTVQSPTTARSRLVRWRRPLFAAFAVVIVLTSIAAWRATVGEPAKPSNPRLTIAVLPFNSYSTDVADQMLAARLTDGVTGELARIGTLGVVSHTSALQFTDVRRPLKEVAQALGADIIVEATVDTEGDQLRVQARLVDTMVDRKGWARDFHGSRAAIPELQRLVAEALTNGATTFRDGRTFR